MFLRNEDIELMIKMENVIGTKETAIFGKDKSKSVITAETEITYSDFIDYISLIERLLNNKKKLSERANKWNKSHPEAHRKHSRDYERRKQLKKGGE